MDVQTLRRMQAVTGETWRVEGPGAPAHVGDFAALYESIGFVETSRLLVYLRDR